MVRAALSPPSAGSARGRRRFATARSRGDRSSPRRSSPRLPIVSTSGWYPDFGFLALISWRLLRSDPWPAWWAAPLGLVNDLFTGYPIGFSIALWSATMLALDLIDRRTMWRDYWIEWVLAAVLIAIDEWLQWRVARLVGAASPFTMMLPPLVISICVFPLSRLDRLAHRPLEARAMKPIRITNAHQSITFSRRMLLLGGAQAAVGGAADRPHGLARDRPERRNTSCCRESNRVQLIPVPPRRGWIIDRNGKPIAINRSSFRVDIIPQQLVDGPQTSSPTSPSCSSSTADEVDRINARARGSRAASSRSRSPTTSPTSNMPRSPSAFPSLPGVAGVARLLPLSIRTARRSASWSAMSAPPRPRNMRRRTRTRCCSSPASRSARRASKRRSSRTFAASRAGSASRSPRAASWSRSSTPSPTAAAARSS